MGTEDKTKAMQFYVKSIEQALDAIYSMTLAPREMDKDIVRNMCIRVLRTPKDSTSEQEKYLWSKEK